MTEVSAGSSVEVYPSSDSSYNMMVEIPSVLAVQVLDNGNLQVNHSKGKDIWHKRPLV